ncbi:MAG: hypothetical protein ACRBN8_46940 [Nannocystales bacterium]
MAGPAEKPVGVEAIERRECPVERTHQRDGVVILAPGHECPYASRCLRSRKDRSMRFILKTRIRSWIALGCALGLGVLAYVLLLRPTEGVAVQLPTGTAEGSAELAVPTRSRKTLGAELADRETRGGSLRKQDGEIQSEDNDDRDWDELSSAERRAKLESDLSRAVEELEAGRGSPRIAAQAEGALSELRAQMYSTPSGRREHEALEERLSMVTEERKDDDVDEEE